MMAYAVHLKMQYTQARILMYMVAYAEHLLANNSTPSEVPDLHARICCTPKCGS